MPSVTNGVTEVDYDSSPCIQYEGVIGICCEAKFLETDVPLFVILISFQKIESHHSLVLNSNNAKY